DQTQGQTRRGGADHGTPAPPVQKVVRAKDRGGHEQGERRRVPPTAQAALEKSAKEPFLDRRVEDQVVSALDEEIWLGWNKPASIAPGEVRSEAGGDRKRRKAEWDRHQEVAERMGGHQPEGGQRRSREPAEHQRNNRERNQANDQIEAHPRPAARHGRADDRRALPRVRGTQHRPLPLWGRAGWGALSQNDR